VSVPVDVVICLLQVSACARVLSVPATYGAQQTNEVTVTAASSLCRLHKG